VKQIEELLDRDARRAIREDLDASLIVEAAAGTGKTSEMVTRIVRVLETGRARVEGIVAVTFTRKAAGELKLRLRQALDEARQGASDPDKRANLEGAIAHLEDARIGTIHAFCAELLRERPVEARVDPDFEELAEKEAEGLYDRAFSRWFQDALGELPEGLRRALARSSRGGWMRDSPTERIRRDGWKLITWRDFEAEWDRRPFARAEEIQRVAELAKTVSLMSFSCKRRNDDLFKGLEPLREAHRATLDRQKDDLDAVEAVLVELSRTLAANKRKGYGPYSESVRRDEMLAKRDHLVRDLIALRERANADLACLLQSELRELATRYRELKDRAGALDFTDLLLRVRNLLRDDASVRASFQRKFSHVFIDELQDTDPLQAEVLLLLSADDPAESDWRNVRPVPGKLFMVGDPKQSIYRFRRADVLLYQSMKDQLTSRGVKLVHLTHSFRAVRSIQRAVNLAFSHAIQEDHETGQPSYVRLTGGPEEPSDRPSIIALPPPRPLGQYGRPTKTAINACLPQMISAFVAWMVNESGWRVRDPEDPENQIDLRARHIAILFRKYVSWDRDITRAYVRELEARGVPHVLVAGRAFHQREEVETIRAALAAIEWPDDELSVYATLKGSLYAIGDEVLFRFKQRHGKLRPYAKLPDDLEETFGPLKDALADLHELNKKRNRRPIVETINDLLERTRAHAGFALRTAGNHVLANVQRIADLARGFEMAGGLSFRSFVEYFDREAEMERSAEAPLLEEGAEGVRIMTVHAAKGLEFPVVILADMTASIARAEPDQLVDQDRGLYATKLLDCAPWELHGQAALEKARDEAEGTRIAYVAATRAKDILVVPAVGTEAFGGWFAALNRALYPPRDRAHLAEVAPLCPPLGKTTMLDEPTDPAGRPLSPIRPGLHRISDDDGSHPVVWWGPTALELEVHPHFGLQQESLLADKGASREGVARYDAWMDARAEKLAVGAKKSLSPFAPTEPAAPQPPSLESIIEEVKLKRDLDRPSGTRFGTLVHTVLRDVRFDDGEARVRELALAHGRLLGATKEEVDHALAPVIEALGSELMKRARSAPACHRELPIMLRTEDGGLLDGTIDLAFVEDGQWVVVDFKTDLDPAVFRAKYLAQMRWYLTAMTRLMGRPARGVLLTI
jgi:ATP-dependent exoDNAse (exonuclease V) beta subunit